MTTKKSLIVVCVVLAIAVGVGLAWFAVSRKAADTIETTEEAVSAISETPNVTVETNPVKEVPDLNPIEKTNPFKTPNPFE